MIALRRTLARLRLKMLSACCARITSKLLTPLWARASWEKVKATETEQGKAENQLDLNRYKRKVRNRVLTGQATAELLTDPEKATMALEDLQLLSKNLESLVK